MLALGLKLSLLALVAFVVTMARLTVALGSYRKVEVVV